MTPGALIFLGGKDVPKTPVLQVIDYKRRTILRRYDLYLRKFNRNRIPAGTYNRGSLYYKEVFLTKY